MAVCWSQTWRKHFRRRRLPFARTWRFYTVTGLSTGLMVARCQLGKERSKTQHCSKKKGFGARRTVAVCDSSKFGRRSLSLIVPTSALQEVITDRGIPKSDLRALKKSGLEVTLV